MLVTMSEILCKAREEGYGVIAPTILSMEHVKVAIAAAEKKKSPIIMNLNIRTEWARDDNYLEYISYVIRQSAIRASVPVAFNLDHGLNFEAVMKAIKNGFTSVMIDASALPYEENIKTVKEVVDVAHRANIPVEAELGCVGMADETFKIDGKYTHTTKTDPTLVKDFVEKTGVDFLAVSIGNAHGPYAKDIVPHIDFELLKQIADTTPIPLVLHGGSGTGDENLTKACQMGICKINVGSDLIHAGSFAASNAYTENKNKGALQFLSVYNKAYQEKIEYYMDVFGSTNKG